MDTQLDPSIVALTKAIGHQESGGKYDNIGDNGHSKGAYQWNNPTQLKDGEIPKNFKGFAADVGANSDDFSPENQDRVAYKTVEKWGKEGLTPAQIASRWNSGNPEAYKTSKPGYNKAQGVKYDVKAYVDNVAKLYEKYNQEVPKEEQYITKADILPPSKPKESSDLKAGNPGIIADITGVGKLGQGLGYAISNLLGTQKGLINTQQDAVEIQGTLLKKIKEFKKLGKDTSRLEEALRNIDANIEKTGNQVSDAGTGGITNGQVLGSAAQTAATVLTAPSLIKSGIGLLKGGASALATPQVATVLEKAAAGEATSALSAAEKLNALTEAASKAEPATRAVLSKAISELTPQVLREAGVGSFAELNPKTAKVLGLGAKALKKLTTGLILGAGLGEGQKVVKGLIGQ